MFAHAFLIVPVTQCVVATLILVHVSLTVPVILSVAVTPTHAAA